MPDASQRNSADAIISNRAVTGERAFVEFSKTLNGQAPGRELQFCKSDPVLFKLPDTATNRSLISEIANGKSLGVDSYGKNWYARTLSDGRQIYVYAQNGTVKGSGVNETAVDIVTRYGLK